VTSFSVIEAPSPLGLWPSGVERLPAALEAAGLHAGLAPARVNRLSAPAWCEGRDPVTDVLNAEAIAGFSRALADALTVDLDARHFPVVLGGDCSILLGNLLALRRRGRFGLFFLDGHADFYQPEAEPKGEVASMDLAIATGRGPDVLADLDGLRPLVREADCVAFGFRDAEIAAASGSQDVRDSGVHVYDLARVRALGAEKAAAQALDALDRAGLDGLWIHLDADVLDDAIMPAVDYRMPDGLRFEELRAVLATLRASGLPVGIDVTIFNPSLDPDGSIARGLARCLLDGLGAGATPRAAY